MSFEIVLHSLWKISDSEKVLEMAGRAAGIERKDFPKEISPKDPPTTSFTTGKENSSNHFALISKVVEHHVPKCYSGHEL
jgi:hypothetical protein